MKPAKYLFNGWRELLKGKSPAEKANKIDITIFRFQIPLHQIGHSNI